MSLCKRLVDGNGLCQPQQLAYHAIQPDTNPPPDSRVCEMTHPMRSNARGDRAQTSFDTMPPTCIISTNNSRQKKIYKGKKERREYSCSPQITILVSKHVGGRLFRVLVVAVACSADRDAINIWHCEFAGKVGRKVRRAGYTDLPECEVNKSFQSIFFGNFLTNAETKLLIIQEIL